MRIITNNRSVIIEDWITTVVFYEGAETRNRAYFANVIYKRPF